MAKKKLINDETLLEMFDSFFFTECEGLPERFSIPNFGNYVRKQIGYENVADYILRRSEPLKCRIKEIYDNNDEPCIIKIAAFRTLDVDIFLERYSTYEKLRKALIERDTYYKRVCASAGYYIRKYNEQSSTVEKVRQKAEALNIELKSIRMALEEERTKRIEAEKRVRKLSEYITAYVNPSIADSLLMEEREFKNMVTIIDPVRMDSNIITPERDLSRFIESNEEAGYDDAVQEDMYNSKISLQNEAQETVHTAVKGLLKGLEDICDE